MFWNNSISLKWDKCICSLTNLVMAIKVKTFSRPPVKSADWKTIFFISQPKRMLWVVVGVKKNRLNEMVLYSTKN